jgi:mobilization protein MobC
MSDSRGRRKGEPGRPRKRDRDRRVKIIRVYVSERELESFRQRAGDRPLGVVIRELMQGKSPESKIPRAYLEDHGQLSKIGNNLNQAVRLAHTGRCPAYLEPLLRRLLQLLARLQHDLLGCPG